MTIIPISEGSFTIDKTKVFAPFDIETDDLQKRPTGSLLVEVQPFCMVTSTDILLIDTGLGFKQNGEMQVRNVLKENGIDPDKITKVLMSHLHKDHSGGVSSADRFGNYHLTFPNATYYVQRREYDYAMETGYPSYMTDEFEILDNHPNVIWLNEDEGTIDGYITYAVTKGHSPFHQVFWIELEDKKIFFGGDDAPQYNQMTHKFIAKYDFDGRHCMELRQIWWEQGKKENWTFLFYHDVKVPMYQFNNL